MTRQRSVWGVTVSVEVGLTAPSGTAVARFVLTVCEPRELTKDHGAMIWVASFRVQMTEFMYADEGHVGVRIVDHRMDAMPKNFTSE